MAFIEGVDLSTKIAGWGTSDTWNGIPTKVVNPHYKTGGIPMRAIPHNSKFMPFSSLSVKHFLSDGERVFGLNDWAALNRFVVNPTSRWSQSVSKGINESATDSLRFLLSYKGGGSYNSLGQLYISGTSTLTLKNCPPVILIYAQAAGGNGGGSRLDGIWIGQSYTGGGGGGSGAFFACYLELPYAATKVEPVLGLTLSDDIVFISAEGTSFLSVGGGGDGKTPTVEGGANNGGAAGVVTRYSLPSNIYPCYLDSLNDNSQFNLGYLAGLFGGRGGFGSGPLGAVVSMTSATDGGSTFARNRFCVDIAENYIPAVVNSSSGKATGIGGGGGARSRFASGGNGGIGSSGWQGSYYGSVASGLGAGGGGGAAGGAGFQTIYNGGRGGGASITIAW